MPSGTLLPIINPHYRIFSQRKKQNLLPSSVCSLVGFDEVAAVASVTPAEVLAAKEYSDPVQICPKEKYRKE